MQQHSARHLQMAWVLIHMIVQFGLDKESDSYARWPEALNVFISRPYFKIVSDTGAGVYLLNSYRFKFVPDVYAMFKKTYVKCGIDFCGWTLEFMWNKAFAK